jgi:amidase
MSLTSPPFDLLTTAAFELQTLLSQERVSSVELVESCLNQIERHNRAGLELRAILFVAPRELALSRAKALDEERAHGHLRSSLHGIPIIVKVSSIIPSSFVSP